MATATESFLRAAFPVAFGSFADEISLAWDRLTTCPTRFLRNPVAARKIVNFT